jgi:Skp family chaperone for outer membrane proteins
MGLKKLLSKLGDMLDPAVELRKKHRKKLKDILKELKSKENALKKKLESTENERKRDRLQKELDIVHNQRMKGVNAMRGESVHENEVDSTSESSLDKD